jgi:hypothetical protein
MNRDRSPEPLRLAVEQIANRCVDHRHDVVRDRSLQVALIEGRHQQHGLLDAVRPQIERLLEFHHRKAVDRRRRLERLRRGGHAEAITIVLDDGKNWPFGQPRDFRGVLPQVGGVDFDPRIER